MLLHAGDLGGVVVLTHHRKAARSESRAIVMSRLCVPVTLYLVPSKDQRRILCGDGLTDSRI